MKEYVLAPTAGKLQEFYDWLVNARGISKDTARDYIRYVQRPLDLANKHSVYAYRLFLKFEGKKPPDWMKPTKKPKPDRRIPSESSVLETLKAIDSERVKIVYLVLLQSGLRLSHAVYLINNIDRLNVVKLNDYYRVDLNIQHGDKRAWVAYLLKVPKKTKVAANWVSNYAKRLQVKPKYIRKFVITKLHEVGVESDIVRFMVGHASRDVHEISYYDRLAKADREYARYAAWLRGFLAGAGVV